MKLAIITDGFLHVGGAEKVLLELIKIYPKADLYIPIINNNIKSEITKSTKGKIHTTLISKIPYFYEHASLLKPLLIFYWERLNLTKYQLVITLSHSFNSKLVNTPSSTIHISYVLTPPRYLSEHYNETLFLKKPVIKFFTNPLIWWLKNNDIRSGEKPNLLISISKTIQKRVFKTYNRKSLLIYPPISIPQKIKTKSGQHYLCFSRLVKQKGTKLAIETCTKLNLPLVVVGTGPELENLKRIAGQTITFTGFINQKKLETIFMNTKAMINCAIEEDFGMVTIEAAARGIPIIGFRSGGIEETILENKTGIFFDKHTVKSLSIAINKFETMTFDAIDCHNFAKEFSTNVFRKKIKTVVHHYNLNKS